MSEKENHYEPRKWTAASLANAIKRSSYKYVATQINAAITAERQKRDELERPKPL